MIYTKFSYLYPPRPEKAIPSRLFRFYEDRKFVAQAKKNGTCNVIAVSPDRTIHAMTRHAVEHKAWQPNHLTQATFQNLPGDGWYVFVAELMHSKISGLRNTNYINDILVSNGEYLIGSTFAARQKLLQKLFPNCEEDSSETHYIIDEQTWLAKNHTTGFLKFFTSMASDKSGNHENEGLVLKDPNATLAICSKPNSNSAWMVKCRHPTSVLAF